MMPHMASVLRVSFPKAGTYMLKTKAGEDYVAGVKTVGEDNVLKVKVVVALACAYPIAPPRRGAADSAAPRARSQRNTTFDGREGGLGL